MAHQRPTHNNGIGPAAAPMAQGRAIHAGPAAAAGGGPVALRAQQWDVHIIHDAENLPIPQPWTELVREANGQMKVVTRDRVPAGYGIAVDGSRLVTLVQKQIVAALMGCRPEDVEAPLAHMHHFEWSCVIKHDATNPWHPHPKTKDAMIRRGVTVVDPTGKAGAVDVKAKDELRRKTRILRGLSDEAKQHTVLVLLTGDSDYLPEVQAALQDGWKVMVMGYSHQPMPCIKDILPASMVLGGWHEMVMEARRLGPGVPSVGGAVRPVVPVVAAAGGAGNDWVPLRPGQVLVQYPTATRDIIDFCVNVGRLPQFTQADCATLPSDQAGCPAGSTRMRINVPVTAATTRQIQWLTETFQDRHGRIFFYSKAPRAGQAGRPVVPVVAAAGGAGGTGNDWVPLRPGQVLVEYPATKRDIIDFCVNVGRMQPFTQAECATLASDQAGCPAGSTRMRVTVPVTADNTRQIQWLTTRFQDKYGKIFFYSRAPPAGQAGRPAAPAARPAAPAARPAAPAARPAAPGGHGRDDGFNPFNFQGGAAGPAAGDAGDGGWEVQRRPAQQRRPGQGAPAAPRPAAQPAAAAPTARPAQPAPGAPAARVSDAQWAAGLATLASMGFNDAAANWAAMATANGNVEQATSILLA